MSELKNAKAFGLSPQMALLHLKWQQIRHELLQEESFQPNASNNAQRPVLAPADKEYAVA